MELGTIFTVVERRRTTMSSSDTHWKVQINVDFIRGKFLPEYNTYLTVELSYLVATNGKSHYAHFYHFMNDLEEAQNFLQNVLNSPWDGPENNPHWHKITDTKQFTWRKPLDWKKLLFRKLEKSQYKHRPF